jgi:hypothetical protein
MAVLLNQQEQIIKQFIEAEAKHEQAKADYSAARDALLALAVKEPGVTSQVGGPSYMANIHYPEKLKWDSRALISFYGVEPPPHVKQTLSIDARDYKRLPKTERDTLASCHQVVVGTPDISVIAKS